MRDSRGMTRPWIALALTALVVAALVGLLWWKPEQSRRQTTVPPLLLYCAAGIKGPVEAVAREYERLHGQPVQLQYGGSGTLLSNVRVTKTGDLYLAADESYIRLGREQGLVAEAIPLARLRPVIAVARGNPKRITGIQDLLRTDVRVSLANPDAASVGSVMKKVLQRTGEWDALEARTLAAGVFKPTVNDVANDVKLGAVDAGIVWDSTAKQYPELEIVRAPALDGAVEQITIGVLTTCPRPAEALRFARYLGARDRGLKEFARQHYEPVEGDEWAETPELVLFSGAMLRPGIEQTLREFERREGVRITTVYNGCGILTAQMRAGERPDAYFSCDTSFMQSVADLYLPASTIVDNHLVIIVPKGNPQNLHRVQDLTRPGLRVGLAHHEKSAMGNITWKMLVAMGQYDPITKNMKVESPTGDFLVNQLRTGSLDAIIACRSNVRTVEPYLDAIPIDHPLARMTQPYAVGRNTRHGQLMNRLLEALVSEPSRQRFSEAGFNWRYSTAP